MGVCSSKAPTVAAEPGASPNTAPGGGSTGIRPAMQPQPLRKSSLRVRDKAGELLRPTHIFGGHAQPTLTVVPPSSSTAVVPPGFATPPGIPDDNSPGPGHNDETAEGFRNAEMIGSTIQRPVTSLIRRSDTLSPADGQFVANSVARMGANKPLLLSSLFAAESLRSSGLGKQNTAAVASYPMWLISIPGTAHVSTAMFLVFVHSCQQGSDKGVDRGVSQRQTPIGREESHLLEQSVLVCTPSYNKLSHRLCSRTTVDRRVYWHPA